MKLPRFEYHVPTSLDEVLALLAEHGDEAKVVAGGQSLVPLLAMRLARPAHLVDINRVPGLAGIDERADEIAFGATARHRVVERSPVVHRALPLLAEAMPLIGHPAIRTRGTFGGTVAHADASAEIPCVLVALDGSVVVRGPGGERTIAAEDCFEGHFTTSIADDECVVEVRIPKPDPAAGYAFLEVARRHGDFALVGAAVAVALDDDRRITASRIALMGVADVPHRARAAEAALVGAQESPDVFEAAAETATAHLRPASDTHGSSAYRRHLASVVIRRALVTACARVNGSSTSTSTSNGAPT